MDQLDSDFISAVWQRVRSRIHMVLIATFASQFRINSLGPIHSIKAFLPLLRASTTKKIIVIGSGAGDVKYNRDVGIANMAAYGMTKAAGLIATTKFAAQLKDEGFVVVTLSPGLVDVTGTVDSAGTLITAVNNSAAS